MAVYFRGSGPHAKPKELQEMNQKDLYVRNLRARLERWKAEIAKRKAEARERSINSQAAYDEEVADLKEKWLWRTRSLVS